MVTDELPERVQDAVDAARRRRAQRQADRAAFQEARRKGLEARKATRLARLAATDDEGTPMCPQCGPTPCRHYDDEPPDAAA